MAYNCGMIGFFRIIIFASTALISLSGKIHTYGYVPLYLSKLNEITIGTLDPCMLNHKTLVCTIE